MAAPRTVGPTIAAPAERRWLGLVVVAIAQLMVALDATIVNIALPSAQRSLHFGNADRQWVVTAYTLTFAGLLLLGGRVADNVGRRRAFLVGLTGFAASSALAGSATGFAVLVTGRALQGAFAALLAPAALSLIAVTFTESKDRAKAFGVYGAVASSGGAAGLLLGGVLTEYLQWRWCLYVNVAIAVAAVLAGRAVLPDPPTMVRAKVDVVSGVLITAGLAAIVFGCSQAVPHGWSSGNVLLPLALGAVAVAAFAARQTRVRQPLLPPRILADRSRAGAYLAVAAAVVGSFGTFLMLTYHFQVVLGYSPVRAALAFLPLTAAVSVSAYALASRLLPRVAPRALIVPGLLVAAAGLLWLARAPVDGSYVTDVLPSMILLGFGAGMALNPVLLAAMSDVTPEQSGLASGVV
ncbi:MAG: hypothetical protein QOK11_6, partial [Pseudonocardiales bacterium]|nr:hypothetical protein [Pseudonocardiales bacterium]